MEELLPDITIKADCKARTFINRFRMITSKSNHHYKYKYQRNYLEANSDYLEIKPNEQNGHKEIIAQIFNQPEKNNIIQVEIRAIHWENEPVTYDIYINEAKRIILPLISEYNKKYNSKRRLTIQTRESLKPKLPPMANRLFLSFVNAANKNVLHPLDWKRFYIFIRHSYSKKVQLSSDDIKRLLIEHGFDESKADYLSWIYYHGKELLSVYN